MAGAAGRRNILKELTSLPESGTRSNIENALITLTPPSPDETVIQHRGQHRKSATYKYGATDPVFFKTPTKSPKKVSLVQKFCTPTKLNPIRKSPRKQLNASFSRNDEAVINMPIKLKRLQDFQPSVQLEKTIKALSYAQLIDLIATSAKSSPEMENILSSLLPWPDLNPVQEKLHALQRNVFKSYPRNVWGSQDGSFCYLRVRAHLEAFKKECLELCGQFMDSQHWPTVFEYIFMALKLAVKLPNWTSVSYNKIKNTCIKQLTIQFIDALKKADLDQAALVEVKERMKEFEDVPEFKICVAFAEDLSKKIS